MSTVPYVHARRVHGIFYGLDLKKKKNEEKNGRSEQAMEVDDGRVEAKGRTLDTHATYMVNSCQRKAAGVFVTNSLMLLNALTLDGMQVLDGSS